MIQATHIMVMIHLDRHLFFMPHFKPPNLMSHEQTKGFVQPICVVLVLWIVHKKNHNSIPVHELNEAKYAWLVSAIVLADVAVLAGGWFPP